MTSLDGLVDKNNNNTKLKPWSLTQVFESVAEEEYLKLKYGDGLLKNKSLSELLDSSDLSESDEYDTDLEDDFPTVKDPSLMYVDHTGSLYYTDICRRQGVPPVNYLLRNMHDRNVRMRHHYLNVNQMKLYSEALQHNTVTETLDLSDNYLGKGGTHFCCDLLKENTSILSLDLSMNFIGRKGMEYVKSMLIYNTTLTTLSLSGNRLNDDDAILIADALKGNTCLSCLDLSHNKFGDLGGVNLAAGLLGNNSVYDLDLSWNCLRENGAAAIVNSLKVNTALEVLDLSWNGLSNTGSQALSKVLRINKTLKVLDISHNRIGTAAGQMLAIGLKTNTGLRSFSMNKNPSCGSLAVSAILKALTLNKTLKFFSMEDITLEADIYEEVKGFNSGRDDLTIIYSGMAVGDWRIAEQCVLSVFIKFVQDNTTSLRTHFLHLDEQQSGHLPSMDIVAGLKLTGFRMTNRQIDILLMKLNYYKDASIDYNDLLSDELLTRYNVHMRSYNPYSTQPDPDQ